MIPRSSRLVVVLTVLAMAATTTLGLLNRAREDRETVREHLRSEELAAETGAAGVAAFINGFHSDLDRLTNVPSVRYLRDPERLESSLRLFRQRTTIDSVGLVRVDTTGRILFVYPEGEVAPEALEALRSSGYLKRVARASEPVLSRPIQVADEEVVAFADYVQSKDSVPLGALIAVFPVSALASPLAGLTEAGERSVLLRFENGTRLRYTGLETVTRAAPAAEPESGELVARAAVASEVVPTLEVELWSTRDAALARRHRSRHRGLLLLALMNGLIGTGGFFLIRELRLRTRVAAAEAHYRALVQHSSDIIFVLSSDGVVSYASASVQSVFGMGEESMIGCRFWDLVHPEEREAAQGFVGSVTNRRAGVERHVFRMQAADATWRYIESLASSQLDQPHLAGLLVNGRDVTDRVVLEQKLSYQALHDPLTGLANRALFQDRVGQAFARGVRLGEPFSVVLLDLDGFKSVNDTLGHACGDELLKTVATRLLNDTRGVDTVARLGGDEFAVLLSAVGGPGHIEPVLNRIAASLQRPIHIGDREVTISGSIGVAVSTDASGVAEILRNADFAMYVAKGSGRGEWTFYDPAMHSARLEQARLEEDLRRAVEEEAFEVAYQPVIDLASGRTTSLEALLRWTHPDKGPISPGQFIPLAEETGLIVPLGRWVLQRACRQAREWQQQQVSEPPLRINVNLSARQLEDDRIVDDVAEALASAGLLPETLVLEITESMLMQNGEETLHRLLALKALGVQLAIDDFGTGYSSLAYLRTFPVDTLKIDRRFVSELDGRDSHSALARTILSLGEMLGLGVVAEGIETEGQLEVLRELRCESGQGFLFARPLSPAQAGEYLRDRGAPPVSRSPQKRGTSDAE